MTKFINRSYNRTEHDDYVLNVQTYLEENQEAVPVFHPTEGYIVGWKIQTWFE